MNYISLPTTFRSCLITTGHNVKILLREQKCLNNILTTLNQTVQWSLTCKIHSAGIYALRQFGVVFTTIADTVTIIHV
jgi:hypothetical protein